MAKKHLIKILWITVKVAYFLKQISVLTLLSRQKTDNIAKMSAKLGDPKLTSKNISSLLVGS